jgi:hypothetical protein
VGGAAKVTRTPDPSITNAVLYQLSYGGLNPTNALLTCCPLPYLIANTWHSRGDPLITNAVLYQLSYGGICQKGKYNQMRHIETWRNIV